MKWVNKFEEIFISLALLAATCLVFLNVVLRAFGGGIIWSEELVRYLIIWVTFIGSSVCIREGTHVGIDLLLQIMSGRIKWVLAFIIYLIAILFSILFITYSIEFVQFTSAKNQLAPSLSIPMFVVYIVLPVSGLLMVLRYVQKIVKLFRTNPSQFPKGASL